MTTREIVMGYFTGWTTKRTADAYALLAPDLEFSGPGASYRTAAEFKPGLEAFAAMLYDWEMPRGVIRIASFFRVADGKIRWYDTRFDPGKLNELRERASHS